MDATVLATEIDRRINVLPRHTTQTIRLVRREYSRGLRDADGAEVLAVADTLVESQR